MSKRLRDKTTGKKLARKNIPKASVHKNRIYHFRNLMSKLTFKFLNVLKGIEQDKEMTDYQKIAMERTEMTKIGISQLKLTPTQRKLAEKEYQDRQGGYHAKKRIARGIVMAKRIPTLTNRVIISGRQNGKTALMQELVRIQRKDLGHNI